jgi:hypothetical protein
MHKCSEERDSSRDNDTEVPGPFGQSSSSTAGRSGSLSQDTITEHELHEGNGYSLLVEVERAPEDEGKNRTKGH